VPSFEISAGVLAASLVAVALGTVVQGSIGFGLALVVVPTLTLLIPESLPGTVLLISLPSAVGLGLRERGAIDGPEVVYSSIGRVFGALGGVWLLALFRDDSLSVLVGVLILVAVALSAFRPRLEVGVALGVGAGFASGVMGTAAGVGGPAMALAYQNLPGPKLRSTIAASFAIGTGISLAALIPSGTIHAWHLVFALELLPGVAAGLWLSGRTARLLDGGWLRGAVLVFATVGGALAVVKGLLG